MAQSIFHMTPSLGHGLPVYKHCHICLPEAPLHLLPIPGPAGGSSVLSGASSCEPPHLQHEESEPQGCSVDTYN